MTAVFRIPDPIDTSSSFITPASIKTLSWRGNPKGATVPTRYPVTAKTSSSVAIETRERPRCLRKAFHEIWSVPATSAIINSSCAMRNKMLRTTCEGRCPRSLAACSNEMTWFSWRKTRCGMPSFSKAVLTGGFSIIQGSLYLFHQSLSIPHITPIWAAKKL